VSSSPQKHSGMDLTVQTANSPYPPLPRTFYRWSHQSNVSSHLIAFIDPRRMMGWVGLVSWPTLLQWTVYPYEWLPINCRSGAGQGKFADQRPTFSTNHEEPSHGVHKPAYSVPVPSAEIERVVVGRYSA